MSSSMMKRRFKIILKPIGVSKSNMAGIRDTEATELVVENMSSSKTTPKMDEEGSFLSEENTSSSKRPKIDEEGSFLSEATELQVEYMSSSKRPLEDEDEKVGNMSTSKMKRQLKDEALRQLKDRALTVFLKSIGVGKSNMASKRDTEATDQLVVENMSSSKTPPKMDEEGSFLSEENTSSSKRPKIDEEGSFLSEATEVQVENMSNLKRPLEDEDEKVGSTDIINCQSGGYEYEDENGVSKDTTTRQGGYQYKDYIDNDGRILRRNPEPEIRRYCPYLHTINRQVLDFDFEKFLSVSPSKWHVYACLVCGEYYRGRGQESAGYAHSLEAGHHVYINLWTQFVYCLPDGYEVMDPSLDDIRRTLNPRYTNRFRHRYR